MKKSKMVFKLLLFMFITVTVVGGFTFSYSIADGEWGWYSCEDAYGGDHLICFGHGSCYGYYITKGTTSCWLKCWDEEMGYLSAADCTGYPEIP
ncbi:MAG: hypothetical protein ACE5HS_15925 [bacterium]